jgi:electron transfer flavoprotein alpha subunit
MADTKGIFVIGESEEGKLAPIVKELLGGARQLADQMKEEVSLLLIGENAAPLAQETIALGADKVYVANHSGYSEFNGDSYTYLISEVCKKVRPSLCLMGQTDQGRDVAPRVAARLGIGLGMDCVEVKFDAEQGQFLHTRPAFGGKALAVMASKRDQMQIDTVRSKSMAPLNPQEGRKGETIVLSEGFDPALIKAKLTNRQKLPSEGIRLEDAKVIVAGGGGVGGPEGFEMVKQLARILGGAPGATRVPVDEKWAPLSMEIGQTGKIVSPELYIAVGISGAAQHITGCLKSKWIVAINKDPEANIFKIANFGLVSDYRAALPVLMEKLKKLAR